MRSLHTFLRLLIFSSVTSGYGLAQQPEELFRPDVLILKFKSNAPSFFSARTELNKTRAQFLRKSPFSSGSLVLSSFFEATGITELRPIKVNASTSPLAGGMERLFLAKLVGGVSIPDAISKVLQTGEVEYAEPDFIGHGDGQEACVGSAGGHLVLPSSGIIPNDPQFGNQWGLRNTGQVISVAGKPGADVNITPGWDISTGSAGVLLAVLDSGIPSGASEFAGRVVPGYDFINFDNDPSDDHGHGTNVTSIAAATGNNNSVMAGINWNCKITHFKTLNAANAGPYSAWIAALQAAADSGANVINMSEGGSGFSQALQDAVTYAVSTGSLVIACMMNTNSGTPFYPAAFSNVIAIGALNNQDNRAVPFCYSPTSGSNFGAHLDFVAPGEMILGIAYQNPSTVNYWCGTSQATPIVSGVVSLMLGLKASLSFSEVYNILKSTAKDTVGSGTEDVVGYDIYYGWGKIDAFVALQMVNAPVSVEPVSRLPQEFELCQNYPNPFNPSTSIGFRLPVPGYASLKIYNLLGREVAVLVNEALAAGSYEIPFDGGNLTTGVYFYRLWVRPRDGGQTGRFVETKKLILLK